MGLSIDGTLMLNSYVTSSTYITGVFLYGHADMHQLNFCLSNRFEKYMQKFAQIYSS